MLSYENNPATLSRRSAVSTRPRPKPEVSNEQTERLLCAHGRTRFAGGPAEAWSTTGVADESLRGSGGAPSMKGHLHLARSPRCPSYKLLPLSARCADAC